MSDFFSRILRPFWKIAYIAGLLRYNREEIDKLRESVAEVSGQITDVHQNLFHRSVGQAITAWAQMEEELVVLTAILLGARAEKAGLILYSIINFYVWLPIISGLFVLEPRAPAFSGTDSCIMP
jgi:hypothetical protein